MTQMKSGGHGKDKTTNNDRTFADRGTSIECKQSYCYIAADNPPPELGISREGETHDAMRRLLSASKADVTEDEVFARVHSLRVPLIVIQIWDDDSEAIDDKNVSNPFLQEPTASIVRPITSGRLSWIKEGHSTSAMEIIRMSREEYNQIRSCLHEQQRTMAHTTQ
jgi:hypothetical protein